MNDTERLQQPAVIAIYAVSASMQEKLWVIVVKTMIVGYAHRMTDMETGFDGGVEGDLGPAPNAATLDPDDRLRDALGRHPTPEELALWATMPGERRDRAVHRIPILRRWTDNPGEMTAAEAAIEAKVVTSRWYEIAAAWKASKTLASVGSFATRPGRSGTRLDGTIVNVIQSILPGIVKGLKDEKVGTIVTRLQKDDRLEGMKLPHVNTLRTMVEREKRRLKGEAQVGGRPGLDAAAVDLPRGDGTYHVVFFVVDRTSRLILGHALGELENSVEAYARASRTALTMTTGDQAGKLPWADGTERVDVVVGEDEEAWHAVKAQYGESGYRPEFSLVTADRRYGRYLKLTTGPRIGNLLLHPARTGISASAAAGPIYSDAEAASAIEVEVARHNAQVLRESVADGAQRPAPETVDVLKFLADR